MNKEEQWIGACDALDELERFGEDLIPGLIECLSDGHPDVRHQAVHILGCARPRSDIAVPDLIKLQVVLVSRVRIDLCNDKRVSLANRLMAVE